MRIYSSATPRLLTAITTGILVCFCLVSVPSWAAQVTDTVVLVQSGDRAPDNTGDLSSLDIPVLQGGSQVAFTASLRENGFSVGSGVYRAAASGAVVQIAREGQPSPDGNGNIGFINTPVLINAAGQVAFFNTFDNSFNSFNDADAMLIGDGSGPPKIIARGGQTPAGAGSPLLLLNDPSGLNAAGQVAFSAALVNGDFGIFRGDGSPGSLVTIAVNGQSLPGGGTISSAYFPGTLHPINAKGEVAFMTIQAESPFARGIWVGDGSGLVEIVRVGDPTPSGNGTIGNVGPALNAVFSNNPINDRGEVAFVAHLLGTSGGQANNQGLYLGNGSTLFELVRRGDPVPDGNGSFLNFLPVIDLDEAGRVAFQATVTGASGGATSGLFIADRTSVRQIIRYNQPAPGGGLFPEVVDVGGIAAGAGVVFRAFVDVSNGGFPSSEEGIFFYDGSSVRSIVREGDTIPGFSTVTGVRLEWGDFAEGAEGDALGDNGQVAFHFTSSGNFRIAVWSGISVFDDGFESGNTSSWSATVP